MLITYIMVHIFYELDTKFFLEFIEISRALFKKKIGFLLIVSEF